VTEWDASDYARISALQKVMADEALCLLNLDGSEHVLDVGCGDGKITIEIAARVPRGSVVGVDPSIEMIDYARTHRLTEHSNLRFEVTDARRLPFHGEFDLVVSFNALHWIPQPDQKQALESIRSAMKSGAFAQLRLVPKGERKSLENILEETRLSSRWASYYEGFHDPYLHLTAEEYAVLAESIGLHVRGVNVSYKSWDFGSRSGFYAFGSVTFVEWTRMLPEPAKPDFINDVLDRYRVVAGDDHTFRFYQMDISVERV
jgi:trans-aconitate 2-methyltransferase